MQPGVLLSLVVPFYNVSAYFSQLLDSIEEQLTEQVQIILICDGATDGSLELAQQHISTSASPESYLLLRQANAGVSVARNSGLAQATGDYIGFVDADDLLLPGYISSVLNVIQQHQPDLIELGYKRFTDTATLNDEKARYLHSKNGWLEKHKAVEGVYQASRWFPWLRVYRKSIAPDFQFPPGIAFCEDVMAMPALYQAAERLYHLRLPLYGYREHSASASFHVKAEHQQQLQNFFNQLQQIKAYPDLSELLRYILLFHLAYLLYKLQLDDKTQPSFPAELALQSKILIRKVWWWPRFSLRKKLHLAFAPFFFQRHRNKSKQGEVS
jgi:glycosyltransferase involved in cell wall biosynthesis